MIPKWHVILGLVFSVILFFLFDASFFNSFIVFLASVFIDFDHYLQWGMKTGNWNLKSVYFQILNLPKNHKPMMHIFHTIEFHVAVLALSFFFSIFSFIFLGMLVHSITDIIEFAIVGKISSREYSLIRYLLSDKKNYL